MDVMSKPSSEVARSLIPARVDRLRWTPFHRRPVVALGAAWVIDGLEITIASSVAGVLGRPDTLGMSATAVGAIAPSTSSAKSSALPSSVRCLELIARPLSLISRKRLRNGSGATSTTSATDGAHHARGR